VKALVLFDEIENLVLAFGEHEGVQVNATQMSVIGPEIKRENAEGKKSARVCDLGALNRRCRSGESLFVEPLG
jgi:hypothetical protein